MTRDYSKYTLSQLREALRAVDERRYPENKAAIEAEIEARKDSGDYAKEEQAIAAEWAAKETRRVDFARKAQTVIAWYLIATSCLVVGLQFTWSPSNIGLLEGLIIAIGMVYFVVSFVGGIAILRGKKWGPALVIGVLCFQIFKISSSTFLMTVISVPAIYITFGAGAEIGITGNLVPNFEIAIGTDQPFLIGIDLFVAWVIYLLVTANDNTAGDAEHN